MASSSPSQTPSGATTTTASSAPSPATHLETAGSGPGYVPRYVDIGVNLTDKMYRGVYHGKKHHEADLPDVVHRALGAGCTKLMVTGSDLHESREAVKLAEKYPGIIYATVGVHPCCAHQFDTHPGGPDAYMAELEQLALSAKEKGLVTAFGEIGLDYDRLMLCPKDPQLKYFRLQLDLSRRLNLPLFLHSRAASKDFFDLLAPCLPHLPGGLVHSFTGTLDEMKELLAAGLYIGINGCSLKTDENLDVVKEIPLDRLMLETDGPWCEIRPSHASAKLLTKLMKDASAATTLGGPVPELPKVKKKEKWEKGARI
ncbi:Mg-dependent DNase, partial [Terfezia boudieri ATCC MYA-4762]